MSDHIETRRILYNIPSVDVFDNVMRALAISEMDRELMRLKCLEGKTFLQIGEILGYSESGIRKRHRMIIRKAKELPIEYFMISPRTG